ncbi:MAG: hypothetical protein Q7J28_15565 [Caulobacter sp.]|nr:hypothetical protein [Caulobacter sp.]
MASPASALARIPRLVFWDRLARYCSAMAPLNATCIVETWSAARVASGAPA